jgi:intracellular sulfur oxidation DsrE/DsrF family protein
MAVEMTHPDDSDALKGVKTIKVIYDINVVSEPTKIINKLKGIVDARDRALAAKVKSDIVIEFRGPALSFIQKPGPDATGEQKQIRELVSELKKEGAKLEACGFAAKTQNLDPSNFLSEVKLVGSSFISLGGFQAKGYSVITA